MITFYNHACFSVSHNNQTLLCDPYLSGTAFDNGWDLIADDVDYQLKFEELTHIYFSHEHPDHFSPPFLKTIPEELRKNIVVIYQSTSDKRLVNFCSKLGFKVVEVENTKQYFLSENFTIRIGQVPFYDSWAIIQYDEKVIVNTNDCILETPERIVDIKKYCDKCDVLFTQYSYANWVEGGVESAQSRIELAEEKLRRILVQCEALKPNVIIPFASMVRFCHVENSYMNDSINSPKKAVEFISDNTESVPLLMEPNQQWDLISPIDNKVSIDYWENAYEKALDRPLIQSSESVSFTELGLFEKTMKKRFFEKNSHVLIYILAKCKLLPKLRIKLIDTNVIYQFNWLVQGEEEVSNTSEYNLEMHSSSLAFIFKFDFGVDTVNVNAKFSGSLKGKKLLIRTFSPLALNNTGRYISFKGALKFINLSFIKQGLRTIGLIKHKAL